MSTLQLLVSLLTIIGSGVVSAVVTYMLNARKSDREFLRGEIELLWTAVHTFGKETEIATSLWLAVLDGMMPHEKALEGYSRLTSKIEPGNHERTEMLVQLYFPFLLPPLVALLLSQGRLERFVHEVAEASQNLEKLDEVRTHRERLGDELNTFTSRIREFKHAIAEGPERWERSGRMFQLEMRWGQLKMLGRSLFHRNGKTK